MITLMKKTETYYSDTQHEAEQFINEMKRDPESEGYEVKSYKIVKKEKKSKGEVVSVSYVIELTKVWND